MIAVDLAEVSSFQIWFIWTFYNYDMNEMFDVNPETVVGIVKDFA